MEHAAGVWVVTRLHGYNKWCCVMRLTSQSALLHSRILNCWDLPATPQPRYQLRHDQNSNSILSRVDIVKIFIHCKNIRGCRVSCLLEHNWGAAECGLLLLLGCGEILIYLIANVATDTVTSRGRPALYHHLTLPQEPSINNVINVRYLQDSWQEKALIVSDTSQLKLHHDCAPHCSPRKGWRILCTAPSATQPLSTIT